MQAMLVGRFCMGWCGVVCGEVTAVGKVWFVREGSRKYNVLNFIIAQCVTNETRSKYD